MATKKYAVSAKARRILEKVKKHILEEPRRLRMETWKEKVDPMESDENPPCGTVACIAGWTCLLIQPKSGGFIASRARTILGLNYEQAQRLFKFTDWGAKFGWPEKFSDTYNRAASPAARAEIAANRIDHFIKTGE